MTVPTAGAMEKLFARQVARASDAWGRVDISLLGRLVCESYEEADRDRRRTDRAMRLMSEELEGANRQQQALLREISIQSLRFEAALHNMPLGLAMYDDTEALVVVNTRFCDILGLPARSILPGMTLEDVMAARHAHGHFPGLTVADALAERRRLVDGSATLEREELIGGRTVFFTYRPLPEGSLIVLVQDVTERRAAEARIVHLAQHDVLTGLANRAHFLVKVEEALLRLQRGRPFALLCLDLDRFKQVNDTLGHPIGDRLLREVTARLKRSVRESDAVARLGGDEFAIIQDATSQPAEATALSQRLIREISAPYMIEGHRIVIGTSVGIALAPSDGTTAETLLKAADLALYRSKADGRGTWRFFEPSMDERMQARRAMEMDLRTALDQDQFELLYQPLIDVGSGRLNGFEALLRWRHPTRGTIAPSDFIPLAEETQLIMPIGQWVLHKACRTALGWPEHLTVAVNVSAVQFRQPQFVAIVAEALSATSLPPDRLELEVTETIMLQDNVVTMAQLQRLRRLGIRISMDDFGTGYSSLSYLRSFPFDKIKIDRSFIRELEERSEARAIISAIAGLGTSLGMRTTAEGVETAEQLDRLRAAGCTDAQGFFFGHPMEQGAIEGYVASLELDRYPEAGRGG